MTEDHDPYAVLGVTPVATPAEIHHAFRVKVRSLHPDTRHPRTDGAARDGQLEQLIAAYRRLRDPERRALYDRGAAAPPTPSPSRRVSATPQGPLTIPVTHHGQPPAATHLLWAGPVRRHR